MVPSRKGIMKNIGFKKVTKHKNKLQIYWFLMKSGTVPRKQIVHRKVSPLSAKNDMYRNKG